MITNCQNYKNPLQCIDYKLFDKSRINFLKSKGYLCIDFLETSPRR